MLWLLGLLGLLGLERRFLLRAAGPVAVQACRVPRDRENEQTRTCTYSAAYLRLCEALARVLAVRKGNDCCMGRLGLRRG